MNGKILKKISLTQSRSQNIIRCSATSHIDILMMQKQQHLITLRIVLYILTNKSVAVDLLCNTGCMLILFVHQSHIRKEVSESIKVTGTNINNEMIRLLRIDPFSSIFLFICISTTSGIMNESKYANPLVPYLCVNLISKFG